MFVKPGKAVAYALLIWLVGFVWGSVVFMTHALKAVPAIPYISANPAISFPILLFWIPLTYVLAKTYLKTASDKIAAGLTLGVMFAVTNAVLDLLVLVIILKAGVGYFVSLTVWLAYAILLVIPWLTGQSLAKRDR
jgi:hypothetical protein